MAMRHRTLPIEGVQFHPESVLTEGGHLMLANWLAACGYPAALERAPELAAEVDARRRSPPSPPPDAAVTPPGPTASKPAADPGRDRGVSRSSRLGGGREREPPPPPPGAWPGARGRRCRSASVGSAGAAMSTSMVTACPSQLRAGRAGSAGHLAGLVGGDLVAVHDLHVDSRRSPAPCSPCPRCSRRRPAPGLMLPLETSTVTLVPSATLLPAFGVDLDHRALRARRCRRPPFDHEPAALELLLGVRRTGLPTRSGRDRHLGRRRRAG